MTQYSSSNIPPAPGTFPASAKTNTLAIIALIAAFFFAPAGLICGIIARSQIKQTHEQGAGMALAAILVSAVILLVWAVGAVLAVTIFDHVITHCLVPMPPNPSPGVHWVCAGNNTWIGTG